ncbi:MAG: YbfB/YjiJ family MFS transporter [Gammaproteobacteria bacterium]
MSVGFARFAYGLILPAMQQDLSWTFTAAGWLNTANALGYLLGALFALKFIPRTGAGPLFSMGMVVTTVAVLCSGFTNDLWLMSLWRVIAGVAGAPVFIAGGVLASGLFMSDPGRNALAIAIYFVGVGFGMLISGLGIPLMLESSGVAGWPQAWLFLGCASAASLPAALWAERKVRSPPSYRVSTANNQALAVRRALPILLAYFMFGVGYFVYMTFLVALMRAQDQSVGLIIATWTTLSVTVLLAPIAWQKILANQQGGGAVALALSVIGVATLLPVMKSGASGLLLSAGFFGIAFAMIPTGITNFAKKNYMQKQWGAAVSLFTVFFAVGQILGPVAAGLIADQSSSLVPGMTLAGSILLIGAVLAGMQKSLN